MHRRIWISLSAALLAFRLADPAEAALTSRQLDIIEDFVVEGNWTSLRAYLLRNPSLWQGDDPLSVEFRRFLENTRSLYTALTFDEGFFPDLAGAEIIEPPAPEPDLSPPPPPPPPQGNPYL